MLAHAVVPALDLTRRVYHNVSQIVNGLCARKWAFREVVLTDALENARSVEPIRKRPEP